MCILVHDLAITERHCFCEHSLWCICNNCYILDSRGVMESHLDITEYAFVRDVVAKELFRLEMWKRND